jgi:hypothetical protein
MKPNGTETTTRGKWSNRGEYDRFYQYPQRSQRAVAKDELRRQERREFSEVTAEEEIDCDCDRPSDEWCYGCYFGDWLEEHDPERPI